MKAKIIQTESGKISRQLDYTWKRVQLLFSNQFAKNTRRAYQADLKCYSRFCEENQLSAFPANPETVALYITDLYSV